MKRLVVSLGTVSYIDQGIYHRKTAVMISAPLVRNEIFSPPGLIFITSLPPSLAFYILILPLGLFFFFIRIVFCSISLSLSLCLPPLFSQ